MKIILALIIVVLIAGCIGPEENVKQLTEYKLKYFNTTLNFRGNLNEAREVPVFPNETVLLKALTSPYTQRIVIAFIDNPDENSYYAAAAFQLSFDLTVFHNANFPNRVVKAFNVSSIDEARNVADEKVPVIMLAGPSITNKTAVTVEDYFILLEGKDLSEVDRVYTDLDLASAKLLLTLLESNNYR